LDLFKNALNSKLHFFESSTSRKTQPNKSAKMYYFFFYYLDGIFSFLSFNQERFLQTKNSTVVTLSKKQFVGQAPFPTVVERGKLKRGVLAYAKFFERMRQIWPLFARVPSAGIFITHTHLSLFPAVDSDSGIMKKSS